MLLSGCIIAIVKVSTSKSSRSSYNANTVIGICAKRTFLKSIIAFHWNSLLRRFQDNHHHHHHHQSFESADTSSLSLSSLSSSLDWESFSASSLELELPSLLESDPEPTDSSSSSPMYSALILAARLRLTKAHRG
eukprot:TRINITY_DN337_c0_g2_i2.p2 TRINITY_DN337_c0_g2~~TRINITY_DN337_c0_g2_i2.p2  ORF type:complete len:135 (-),score=35.03 TRINITY_DN337_c0_g2_i2:2-406(-)